MGNRIKPDDGHLAAKMGKKTGKKNKDVKKPKQPNMRCIKAKEEICPKLVPVSGTSCEEFKEEVKRHRGCKHNCHYGDRCCRTSKPGRCFKDIDALCTKNGKWKIERERCSKHGYEKCDEEYDYTKVGAMNGKVYDECLAEKA